MLQALSRLEQDAEQDRLPLPMDKLARYGLSRAQLRSNSAAREQAVKAQLEDLHAGWRQSVSMAEPLSVFRAVESQHAGQLMQRAARGGALMALRTEQSRAGLSTAWHAWRAARDWHHRVP
jgi:phytoene synthase